MKIVFATQNENKVAEIQQLMPSGIEVMSLKAIGCTDDIPETAETLEGNALIKARYVAEKFGVNCFADDTGLEIVALHGKPGVLSARYAGENKSADANMNRVLKEMQNASDRKAQFRTVIAAIIDGKELLFEGIVTGMITEEKSGEKGFGYDPVFLPDGCTQTFAEMDLNEKNKISHRGKAVSKLIDWLKVRST
jgi:XTP/dITP diphosphohydrolase